MANKWDTTINDNRWHYIVYVVKTSPQERKLYVDGVQEGGTDTSSATISGGSHWRIGMRYSTQYPYCLNGLIDNVAIYNRALTPEEIRKMYEASPLSSSCVYTCNDNRYCNPKSPDNPATPGVTETACCSTVYCQNQTCIYSDIKVIPAVNYYYRTISVGEAAKSDFSEYKTGKTICLPPVEMREK